MRLALISLLMIPLTLGCDGDEEKPAAEADADADAHSNEDHDTHSHKKKKSHRIELKYDGWQAGEYHFVVDVPDLGERYECVSVLPGGIYMGDDNCPADVIGTEIRITEENMEPTALLIYRSDFSAAYVSVSYINEDMTDIQSLAESEEITPVWIEDELCECTTSDPSTVTF